MKRLLKKIFSSSCFKDKPPILVDVGASGEINERWKKIAPYSVCLAFDADTRDFAVSEFSNKGYKKLYKINRVVAQETCASMDFYLTKSPHCSSVLKPNTRALDVWAFSSMFQIREKVSVPSITLERSLKNCGLNNIDWFKTDSQGTDLRIFSSLPEEILDNIILAEFEPGIIDSYEGEDKLSSVLQFMGKKPFWAYHMNVKGTQKITKHFLGSMGYLQRRFLYLLIKSSPCWCEIAYLNKLEGNIGAREYFLGWVFSTLNQQHGFALSIATKGNNIYGDKLFEEMINYSNKRLSPGIVNLAARVALNQIVKLLTTRALH